MIAATNPAVAGLVAAIGPLRIKAETKTEKLIRLTEWANDHAPRGRWPIYRLGWLVICPIGVIRG